MKRKLLHTLLLSIVCSSIVFGQQEAIFTQYMFNGLAINPAYAGSHDVLTLNAIARKQWIGVPGSPLTFMGSGHSPIVNKNVGIGFIYVNDQAGFVTQNGFAAMGSYRIRFPNSSLSFGLQMGITNYRTEFNKITTQVSNDPNFLQTDYNAFVPNFGGGLYYLRKNLSVGLSVPNIMDQILNSASSAPTAIQRRYYMLFAAYLFNLSPYVKLKPSLLYKVAQGVPMQLDINANIIISKVLWFGVSYRSFSSINLTTQFDLSEQFTVGYAFDISTVGLKNNASSHELMLQYKFNFFKTNAVSPRYF
ncbi:MAG: type IX secretion system membrane protein PorP/SprF [Cytophagales bacterium]|nr:type IX secretion system membrane protein PorP/SprF [Cytophagales bacterium]